MDPAPPSTKRSFVARFLRAQSIVELEALLPDLATGLRAAIATVVPLAIAAQTGRPALAWMALGGWLGTLVDPGGSRWTRARVLVVFAIVGALDLAFCEIAARSALTATIALATIAFVATMLRALDASASSLGTMLAIIAALATARRASDPIGDAIEFAEGAAVALVLSSIVWPIWTHLPLRRSIAPVYRELADYAKAIEGCVAERAKADDPRWITMARTHPRSVRLAIEDARAMAVTLRARRSGESAMGGNLRVLLGGAEEQFHILVGLATEIENADEESRGALVPIMGSLATTWTAIANVLLSRAWKPEVVVPSSAPALTPIDSRAPSHLASLAVRLLTSARRARVRVTALDRPEDEIPLFGLDATPTEADSIRARIRRLVDALAIDSPIFRHALRVMCAGAIAALVGTGLRPAHAAWVSITAIVVSQPYAGATLTRAIERSIGATLGSFVAVAIALFVRTPVGIAAAMFPLSIAALVTRPRSYRLFTFFLTPVFVLVAMHGPGDWITAAERAGDSILGGLIALACATLVLPGRIEALEMSEAIATMESRVRAYVQVVRAKVDGETIPTETTDAARRAAAIAISDAEASLERLLAEPLRRRGDEAATLSRVVFGRRLALSTTTLDMLAATPHAERTRVDEARARVDRFLELLTSAAPNTSAPDPRFA